MITFKHTFRPPDTYPLDRLGRPDKLLFFDIETTGFSAEHHQIYLIGCTFYTSGTWNLIQWFADTPDAEKDILSAFYEFIGDFTTLIHFNGDGFDIPFLLKRFQVWNLPRDLSSFISIDIYKRIRPFRKLLGLDSLKQKSIEQFLGIFRQDPYSGGQLIDVYKQYLETRREPLCEALMLHNREDLEGMPLILPILYYADLPGRQFALEDRQVLKASDIFGEPVYSLLLTLKSPDALPVPVCWETGRASCKASENRLELTVPLLNGTLKYFYPDYENYYYLIYEDTAIHKSVGEFVERGARKKATAQTCYTKKTGLFLPQPDTLWPPAFKKACRAKQSYAQYSPELFDSPEALNDYVRYLLDV